MTSIHRCHILGNIPVLLVSDVLFIQSQLFLGFGTDLDLLFFQYDLENQAYLLFQ